MPQFHIGNMWTVYQMIFSWQSLPKVTANFE